MNDKAKKIIQNLSYSTLANFFSAVISVLLVLLIPKIMGVREYGLWQLSVFYNSYVGYLHFGWIDGMYLRYGGYDYESLDKPMFQKQFYLFCFFESCICIIIFVLSLLFLKDYDKRFIFILLALTCIIQLPGTFLRFVMQATNRIRDYARNLLLERIVYGGTILGLLLFGICEYKPLIVMCCVALAASTIHAMLICKDIVYIKSKCTFQIVLSEAMSNIKCGVSLLLANFASMFILGFIRLCIEYQWSIETFAKLSLSLNVCTFIMVFVNSVGVVVFPIIKKLSYERMKELYLHLNALITTILLIILIAFFPCKWLLNRWLPQYTQSILFLGILFPMCLYESKMALLYNTFLKAMRKERVLLILNAATLVFSIILSVIAIFSLKHLLLSVLVIIISLGIRCIMSEVFISNIIGIRNIKYLLEETFLIFIFIFSTTIIKHNILAFIVYGFFVVLYLLKNMKSMKIAFKYFSILR